MIKDKQEAHKQGNTGGVRRLWTANQRKLSSCSYCYLIINNFLVVACRININVYLDKEKMKRNELN